MTRAEFFERLRYIRLKASPAVDKEARRAVRIQTLKAIARAQEILLKGGNSESVRAALDKQNLAKEYLATINSAKEKTARLTSEANAEFLISQLKEAGIAVKENAVEGITEQIVNKVLKKTNAPFENAKHSHDCLLKNAQPLSAVFKAKGWAADKGVGFYTIDPKTGAKKFVEKSFYMKFSKGYDLSSSVWKSVGEMESRILNTVWASRAQGRDAVKTAKDLENLVFGTDKVLGSWGKLKPGTAEYIKRMGKQGIDYRALRIVRTENARAMNDAIKESAKLNPSTTGEFEWILVPSREEWNCECAEYAAHGPYKADELPEIPAHPNCVCQIRPVLKQWDDFKKELLESDGNNLPDLDEWISGGANDLTAEMKAIGDIMSMQPIGAGHILQTKPEYKDLFDNKGTFKDFSDFNPTTENKKAFFKSLDFQNGKSMTAVEFEPFYKSVKDITDEIPELLGNSNGKAVFGDYIKGFDSNRPQDGGVFYNKHKMISFATGINQNWVDGGIAVGTFHKGMTVKDVWEHEMMHGLTLSGKTASEILTQREAMTNNVIRILKEEYGIAETDLKRQVETIRKEISGYASKSFEKRIILAGGAEKYAGCEAFAEAGWIAMKEGNSANPLIRGIYKEILKNVKK